MKESGLRQSCDRLKCFRLTEGREGGVEKVGGRERKGKGDMWAEKNSHVLKQTTASESVKSSSLYFEFVLTN